jgi:hypothetical protein
MKSDIQSVLWDIKKDTIPSLPREFVVGQTLTYGTIDLIVKAIHEHGLEYVYSVFSTLKPTAMMSRKYLYLKNYLLK